MDFLFWNADKFRKFHQTTVDTDLFENSSATLLRTDIACSRCSASTVDQLTALSLSRRTFPRSATNCHDNRIRLSLAFLPSRPELVRSVRSVGSGSPISRSVWSAGTGTVCDSLRVPNATQERKANKKKKSVSRNEFEENIGRRSAVNKRQTKTGDFIRDSFLSLAVSISLVIFLQFFASFSFYQFGGKIAQVSLVWGYIFPPTVPSFELSSSVGSVFKVGLEVPVCTISGAQTVEKLENLCKM